MQRTPARAGLLASSARDGGSIRTFPRDGYRHAVASSLLARRLELRAMLEGSSQWRVRAGFSPDFPEHVSIR